MSSFERTYGEILDIAGLYYEISLLLHTKFSEYTFYDFGSGYGKVVRFFSKFVKKSIGYEIDKERYIESLKSWKRSNVSFENIDMFDADITESPRIVFVNNVCFKIGTNKRLSLKLLDTCRPGDIVVTTLRLELLEKYFVKKVLFQCSWSMSETYFYVS